MPEKIHAQVLEALGRKEGPARIIVLFESAPLSFSLAKRELPGLRLHHHLSLINGVAGEITEEALEELAIHPLVARIYPDREVRALLDVASPTIGAERAWGEGLTGRGVGVAVIDTGVYLHPDLYTPFNRIVAFHDLVRGSSLPYDDNGHGTHVAGIVLGNGTRSRRKYKGVAPEANLVAVKALDGNGSGRDSQIITGIQWCMENKSKYNIRVLNLSLGSTAIGPAKDDPLCLAVEKAWDAGIVVCAAAGNEGPGAGTIDSPGIDPRIITVGAMDDKGTADRADDGIADFSSRGPTVEGETKPDLLAPGKGITSLRAPRGTIDRAGGEGRIGQWYMSLSGTSMATPFCAGTVALMAQKNPRLTPDQVKSILQEAAEDRGYEVNAQGKGYIDAYKALARVAKGRW
ncbi:MAG: S8 family serine peptidase [Firmicutes bacterium]|nr:S8 family serine peptidase [Bacillota bacterium]MCL5040646.1 S8 family serine peptidase [Bacillota bacterium]